MSHVRGRWLLPIYRILRFIQGCGGAGTADLDVYVNSLRQSPPCCRMPVAPGETLDYV